MEWTHTLPNQSGFYWLDVYPKSNLRKPEVVEVFIDKEEEEIIIYTTGSEVPYDNRDVYDDSFSEALWYGPILQPPRKTV